MVTAVDAVATFPTFTYGLLSALHVTFCRDAMPMHPANDYSHPYEDAGHLVLHTRLNPVLCATGIAADTALLPPVTLDPLACAPMF
jgi:hypothetical protein